MPFRLKITIAILALLVLVVAVAPLLVAPGDPPGVRPLAEVAGPAAEYVTVEGIDLHVVRRPAAGSEGGSESGSDGREGEVVERAGAVKRLFVLLHGFPFSSASFDALAPLLVDLGDVVAVDLPGFGLSERPLGEELNAGLNPYSAAGQVALVRGLVDELVSEERSDASSAAPVATEVFLVGTDSGARLALDVALDLASGSALEPAAGLVLIGASPFTSSSRSALARAVMNSPQLRRLGPVFLRQIAQEPGVRILRAGRFDPTRISQEELDAYHRPWTVEGWDAALWELTKAEAPPSLEGRLGALDLPVLVVAGEEDGVVPNSESQRLADELGAATLELLPACGHAVQAECPQELAQLIEAWVRSPDSDDAAP